jgi:hypothetical protein
VFFSLFESKTSNDTDLIWDDNWTQFVKILETKTSEDSIYLRVQNISDYEIKYLMVTFYLLDSNGKPIHEETYPFDAIPPNYIVEGKIPVIENLPEWTGQIKLKEISGAYYLKRD